MERDTLEQLGLMFKASKSFNQLFFSTTMRVCSGMMCLSMHAGLCVSVCLCVHVCAPTHEGVHVRGDLAAGL